MTEQEASRDYLIARFKMLGVCTCGCHPGRGYFKDGKLIAYQTVHCFPCCSDAGDGKPDGFHNQQRSPRPEEIAIMNQANINA